MTNEDFREGCRCPRLFWLEKQNGSAHHARSAELAHVAQSYIKGGRCVSDGTPEEMAEATVRLICAGQRIIKNPAFILSGTLCRADILRIDKTGLATIYFSQPALHVRRAFCREAALLYSAAEDAGFEAVRVVLLLPDKAYTRCGEIEPRLFLRAYDLTQDARALKDKTYGNMRMLERLAGQSTEPKYDIHTGCFAPETCKYFAHCTAHLPNPNVFKVARLNQNTKLKLYNEDKYSYEALRDHPALTDAQRRQVKMSLDGAPATVKKKELREFLETLWYPMYFLDFESWQPPVPPSDGMKAFEQVPFQYSLHIIEHEGAEVRHTGFLAGGEADPREPLARRLAEDIPENACVVVYNKQFEKMVVEALAQLYPELSEHLMQISANIRDLMTPFQKKLYYDRRMEGSFSIKAVLPALYPDNPELCYDNLEGVHNGSEAMLTYAKMTEMSDEELERTRAELDKYCGLDTFGMVKILEKLFAAAE